MRSYRLPWSLVASGDAISSIGQLSARPARVAPVGLADLLALVPAGVLTEGSAAALPVRGISSNSTLVRQGDLFAALPGTHGHGVNYLAQAKADGAVAVLTDPTGAGRARELGLPIITAPEPRTVLGALSARIYGNPSASLRVVGVTGTSGKTTTTSLVRTGLTAAGVSNGLVGTLGVFVEEDALKTPFTTPEAPQLQALLAMMLERGVQCVAMEVSSHALRLGRVDGVEFAVGAFTNLSQDHLDFHSDMGDYFNAKAKLFDGRARREIVVIDDEWGARLRTRDTVTVTTRVEASDADWRAESIETQPDGSTRFTAIGPGLRIRTGCRIPGRYNIANSLLALAILSHSGVDVARVAPVLAQAQVPGRMQRVDLGQPYLVVVDYSHKPAGVREALAALRALTRGRLLIVFGCGGDRDRGKRPLMGELAARNSDVLIVTDDNPRSEDPARIRAEILAGARSVPAALSADIVEEGARACAIETALSMVGAGDTVLIAGKGHETGQEIAGVTLPFDDVAVAEQTLMGLGFTGPRR